jgi:hypothetical protein
VDIETLSMEIEGHHYATRKNGRIKWAEFWTLLRDGKPLATLEHTDRYGWRGTFSTNRFNSALWCMSDNVSLDDRVRKMHDAHESFLSRLIIP